MMILLFNVHPQEGESPDADKSWKFSGRVAVGRLLYVIQVEAEIERLSQEVNHEIVGRE